MAQNLLNFHIPFFPFQAHLYVMLSCTNISSENIACLTFTKICVRTKKKELKETDSSPMLDIPFLVNTQKIVFLMQIQQNFTGRTYDNRKSPSTGHFHVIKNICLLYSCLCYKPLAFVWLFSIFFLCKYYSPSHYIKFRYVRYVERIFYKYFLYGQGKAAYIPKRVLFDWLKRILSMSNPKKFWQNRIRHKKLWTLFSDWVNQSNKVVCIFPHCCKLILINDCGLKWNGSGHWLRPLVSIV